jgi:hypothetical protein
MFVSFPHKPHVDKLLLLFIGVKKIRTITANK